MRRSIAALGTAAVLVVLSPAAAAWADDLTDPGFDDAGPDMGIPGWFVAVFVLVLVLGIGSTVYKVTAARDLARRSGLDPDDAARATLLDEDGYAATYLASQVRRPADPAPPSGAARPVADRLRELDRLRDEGLITADEHAARRAAVLDDL